MERWRNIGDDETFLIFLYITYPLQKEKKETKSKVEMMGRAGNALIYIKTDRFVWRVRRSDVCATADGPIALFPRYRALSTTLRVVGAEY